jgi:hypothetical protein
MLTTIPNYRIQKLTVDDLCSVSSIELIGATRREDDHGNTLARQNPERKRAMLTNRDDGGAGNAKENLLVKPQGTDFEAIRSQSIDANAWRIRACVVTGNIV